MMLVPNGVQGRLWAAVLITLVALETIAALVPPGGSTGAVPPRAAGETGWAPAAPPPKRTTTTTVTCTPGTIPVDSSTSCTATVRDTDNGKKTAPDGTVTWTTDGGGIPGGGTFSSPTCILIEDTDRSSCSVTYTPTAVGSGSHLITASYGGGGKHLPSSGTTRGSGTIPATYRGDAKHKVSSGSTTVPAAKRSTATSVACTPGSVVVDQTTTCTATVSDTGPGTKKTPTGTVTWMSSGVGTFSSATCTLDGTGKCSVMYTPTLVGSGTHTITASYPGDASHMGSSGSFPLGVGKRQTTTGVVCTPSQVPVESPTTCTATVFDASAGTKSPPSGTVSWASSGSGTFSSTTCMLTAGQCSVSYTPTAIGSGIHTITADYGGDSTHAPSSGTTTVTVRARTTNTMVSCSPPSVPVDDSTTCTATVSDTDTPTASTPGGTVSFTTDSSGTFAGNPCTLSSGSCSVTYTPTAVGTGVHKITATYKGDAKHASSSGPAGG